MELACGAIEDLPASVLSSATVSCLPPMQEPSARTTSQVQCACYTQAGVKSGFVARGLVGALPVAKLAAVQGCVIEWKPCSQANSASNITPPVAGLNIPAVKSHFPPLVHPHFLWLKGAARGRVGRHERRNSKGRLIVRTYVLALLSADAVLVSYPA